MTRLDKDDTYVKALDQFCDNFEASQEDFSLDKMKEELTFREEFLRIGDRFNIKESGHLVNFVNEFKDKELGLDRQKIKSPAILFRQLFRTVTISYAKQSESYQLVESRFSKAEEKLPALNNEGT